MYLEDAVMKLERVALFAVMLVAGCAAPATETSTATQPATVGVQPTAANVPTATATEVPPTLAAVTGPAMEVGSRYYYVDGTTLVAVPAGEFLMGADGEDNPNHTVSLSDYWIYSTKVTNQQYAWCEALGNCTPPNVEDNSNYQDSGRANDPVVGITYDQAIAYCTFVQGRLPTEAEWEKAARNPDGGLYPWGDEAPSCDLTNFNNCVGGTTSVTNYAAAISFYGVLDVVGNTFEWVADWYAADYYASSPQENPQGPEIGSSRTIRSSSYVSDANQLSVAIRGSEDPQTHRPDLGFRCVVEDPTYFAPFCEVPLAYGMDTSAATRAVESCPALNITQAPYCVGKLPLTNVKFEGPSDATIDASNCTPSNDPNLFTCQAPETVVSITADCQVDLSGNSLCPDGFSQQGSQCVASGGVGECLAGEYDSAQGCCQVQDSTDVTSPAPVCPVGTFYSKNENACLAYPVKELVTVTQDVLFAACTTTSGGGGGGDGGSGEPTSCAPLDCGPVNSWSPTLCCCTEYFNPNTCQ
jgi:formylglycine-generating enzyme required for sulfatase activity